MMKLFPNELPIHMPGVKPVLNVTPCDTNIVTETVEVPEEDVYTATKDTAFAAGKTYYEKSGDTYVVTTDTVMQEGKVYYEKTTKAATTLTVQTVYDRYTDGFWVDISKDGRPVASHHPVEIIKTISSTDNTSKEVSVSRWHAKGLWADRKTLSYVPICYRLEADKYGESARAFR